jgi:hypothetical protein
MYIVSSVTKGDGIDNLSGDASLYVWPTSRTDPTV